MTRAHTGIKAGDLIRCPDRATARWHRVVRVGKRRDGTRYVTVKARRFWRLLGAPTTQRIEWGTLQRMGFGIRRGRVAELEPPPQLQIIADAVASLPLEIYEKHETVQND